MDTIITAFIAPVVVAAIISAIVSRSNNNKTMSLKYITEERANWRKTIKENVSELYALALNPNEKSEVRISELVTFLIISLNPSKKATNKLDNRIASLLVDIEKGQRDKDTLYELRYCISVLMKHDWERSKNETRGILNKYSDEHIKSKTLDEYYEPVLNNKTQ
ncbi:hypothetical protein BK125_20805 [Paenibacillus odorifer]|uniref:Co-chaperone DjlA N-terminal domain-containing protein n=1 Tax=Paenibacillus odorifer TaxID=189426 RepID=A0ABX3GDW2_9BACL|nr:hypothetical protein [Paenibacillus odorifer]OMC74243.1 hypothetical protein BK125_20805 [Paenibacillus odorifer]OMD06301.1 hypothetical protein BSO21_30830 [Paenibacillus odorifer]OMD74165.1 hypothetical protein BSK50_21295 [Paenibacillus odorifer]